MDSASKVFIRDREEKSKGSGFKLITGCEFYYHPDLDDWRSQHLQAQEDRQNKKKKKNDDDEIAGATVEDESLTKTRFGLKNPLNERHHMVILPKSRKGLENMFKLVSKSYRGDNFYKFPRIDRKMLIELGEDLIISTACISGVLSHKIFGNLGLEEISFDEMFPNILDNQQLLRAIQ